MFRRRAAPAGGVPAVLLIAGFCVHDEFGGMVRAGMTPSAALQTATINPARYLGREQTLGSVAPGKVGNLVPLDANPLEDIADVRGIHAGVVSAGWWSGKSWTGS